MKIKGERKTEEKMGFRIRLDLPIYTVKEVVERKGQTWMSVVQLAK